MQLIAIRAETRMMGGTIRNRLSDDFPIQILVVRPERIQYEIFPSHLQGLVRETQSETVANVVLLYIIPLG